MNRLARKKNLPLISLSDTDRKPCIPACARHHQSGNAQRQVLIVEQPLYMIIENSGLYAEELAHE